MTIDFFLQLANEIISIGINLIRNISENLIFF